MYKPISRNELNISDAKMTSAVPGTAPDVPVGTSYSTRNELCDSGVHGVRMQGIWTADKVAIGIVLNGGYEDDVDEGDRIIYTGDGGRDAATGKQVADQELTAGNRGLAAAMDQGLPIRVSRGWRLESKFAPADGFRYDGMYRVEDRDYSRGAEGFYVWKFLLVRDPAADQITVAARAGDALGSLQPGRKSSQIERVIRSSAVADAVKKLYDFMCQICGLRLEKATGGYAEGAHIRPLGMLHNGPDVLGNILCLCPNDHVLFDDGAIWIDEALARVGPTGEVEGKLVVRRRTGEVIRDLTVHREHRIDLDQIRYHQEHRDSGTRRLERARNLAENR
jgi:putative restriction endonuclease